MAKQASSLAHLSRGRMVLGVGVGTHAPEYAASGVDFKGRGRRLDEAIDAMRLTWEHNEDPEVDGYQQLPAGAGVPVWVGGSSEAALRRAAARADGWIPLFLGPDEYAAAMARLDKEADRAGRDRSDVDPGPGGVRLGGRTRRRRAGTRLDGVALRPPAPSLRPSPRARGRPDAAPVPWRATSRPVPTHIAVFVTDDDPLVQFEDVAGELAGLCLEAGRPVGGPR